MHWLIHCNLKLTGVVVLLGLKKKKKKKLLEGSFDVLVNTMQPEADRCFRSVLFGLTDRSCYLIIYKAVL